MLPRGEGGRQMKRDLALLSFALVLCVAILSSPDGAARDYYISPAGDDHNPGTSPSNAWQTISKVNSWDFKPGDRILFQGGQTLAGNLVFTAKDAGTSRNPVTVGSYGERRATIRAGNGTGILVENAGGFSVRDLVVVGEDRITNKGSGIWIANRLPGAVKLDYVRIDNVDVSRFGSCGILAGGDPADGSKSGFNDVRITRAVAHDNAYFGIYITGKWDPAATAYANTNVYIGHCQVYDNPGDPKYLENHSGNGILLEDVEGGMIERSVAYNNGWLCNCPAGGPVGIWSGVANRVTIQYCESYNNRTGQSVDGGGFDFDGGVTNSVMQYNYSHGNDGAGYLLYTYKGSPQTFRNNVLRYCISENDGRRHGYAGIFVGNDGSGVSDLEIYHNTVYISPAADGGVSKVVLVYGTTNVHFRNNIFLTAGGVPLVEARAEQKGLVFQGNDYWPSPGSGGTFCIKWAGASFGSLDPWRAATGQEKNATANTGLSVDPQLADPGKGVIIGNPDLLNALAAYKLLPGSPMIGAGLDLRRLFRIDPGPNDFYGTTLAQTGATAIGAHQGH